jgi:hypothetical protein
MTHIEILFRLRYSTMTINVCFSRAEASLMNMTVEALMMGCEKHHAVLATVSVVVLYSTHPLPENSNSIGLNRSTLS